MKKWCPSVGVVAALCVILVWVIYVNFVETEDAFTDKAEGVITVEQATVTRTNMPPGYHLEVNLNGEYRSVWTRHNIPMSPYGSKAWTRENAIDRAWGQHHYMNPTNETTWTRVVEAKP